MEKLGVRGSESLLGQKNERTTFSFLARHTGLSTLVLPRSNDFARDLAQNFWGGRVIVIVPECYFSCVLASLTYQNRTFAPQKDLFEGHFFVPQGTTPGYFFYISR